MREKQKPAPPLFHDISAGLARVWLYSSETYTLDNYRAVTVRRFMTHPRIRKHTCSRLKKKSCCCLYFHVFMDFMDNCQLLTGRCCEATVERPVGYN